MAQLQAIPERFAPFLKSSKRPGEFHVKDWTKWFARPLARFARLNIAAGAGLKFASQMLTVRTTRSGIATLIIDQLQPDPPEKIEKKPLAMIGKFGFVEGGCVVMTSFNATMKREVRYKEIAGVEVDEIGIPRVTLMPYMLELTEEEHQVQFAVQLEGKWVRIEPNGLSIEAVRFKGDTRLPFRHDRAMTLKASLKLEPEAPALPMVVQVVPGQGMDFLAKIVKILEAGRSMIESHVDQTWLERAKVIRRRQKEQDRHERESAKDTSINSLIQRHHYLLSEDESWEQKLRGMGKVRRLPDADIDYVIDTMGKDRCDVIVADADFWGEKAVDLMKALHFDPELRKIPVFWIASQDWVLDEEQRRFLVGLGAFDLMDRTIPSDELEQRLDWAVRGEEIGKGPGTVIISPSTRQQYRLGQALYRRGMKAVKVTTMDNPLSALNKARPTAVIVDGVSIGPAADQLLQACLNWRNKGGRQKYVFFLTQFVDPTRVHKWKEQGLSDILLYDHSVEEPAARIQHYMARHSVSGSAADVQ